jgi:hypothetical protein
VAADQSLIEKCAADFGWSSLNGYLRIGLAGSIRSYSSGVALDAARTDACILCGQLRCCWTVLHAVKR